MTKIKLTPKQALVMKAIEDGKGHAHLPCSRGSRNPISVKMKTLETLGKRGLIHWAVSGGWAAVCSPELSPEEPREHILRDDLRLVLEALTKLNGTASDHWKLHKLLNESQISYHSMMDAVRYGSRKGVLKVGEAAEGGPGSDWSISLI